jgi:hypothetical protein
MVLNKMSIAGIECLIKNREIYLKRAVSENTSLTLEKKTEGFSFLSKNPNIKKMKDTDPRIKTLNRNYLYTHVMTKEQHKELTSFLESSKIELNLTPSLDSITVFADNTKEERIDENERI